MGCDEASASVRSSEASKQSRAAPRGGLVQLLPGLLEPVCHVACTRHVSSLSLFVLFPVGISSAEVWFRGRQRGADVPTNHVELHLLHLLPLPRFTQVRPTPAPSSAFFPRNQGFPLRRYSGNRRRPVGFGVTGSCAGRGRRVADDQLCTWNSTRSVTIPHLALPRCAYAGTSFGVTRSDTIGRGGGGRWGPRCPACPGYTLSPVPTRTDTAGRSA